MKSTYSRASRTASQRTAISALSGFARRCSSSMCTKQRFTKVWIGTVNTRPATSGRLMTHVGFRKHRSSSRDGSGSRRADLSLSILRCFHRRTLRETHILRCAHSGSCWKPQNALLASPSACSCADPSLTLQVFLPCALIPSQLDIFVGRRWIDGLCLEIL